MLVGRAIGSLDQLPSTMNPWIAKAVVVVASVVMIAIRAPHGRRSRAVKTVRSGRGALEAGLLILAWIGFLVPLLWVSSPAFSFADYPLHLTPLAGGIACLAVGLWLFYRAHADLGAFWSVTLEVRENHRLISQGIYRRVRHPMYSALFLYAVGQALVVPNWVAGPSYLVAFGILFACRIRAEEQMMVDAFGDEYVAYMERTKRLVPNVW
jgi:protein-S-isoprenylcysteine O-methyltransferase Ste14